MKSHYLKSNGKEIFAVQAGEGDTTLIFLHGNSCSIEIWKPLFESSLSNNFKLVAFDFPGHGKSEKPASPEKAYTLNGLADCVVNISAQLSSKNLILIGNSLGGHAAIHAMKRISNIKGLIVFGTPPLGTPPDLAQAFLPHPLSGLLFSSIVDSHSLRQLMSLMVMNESYVEELSASFLNTDPMFRDFILQTVLNGIGTIDEVKALRESDIPIVLLNASDDVFINPAYVKNIGSKTKTKVSTLRGRHLLSIDNPEKLASIILEFATAISQH